MAKWVGGKVDATARESLPLGLVDGDGESQADGKLEARDVNGYGRVGGRQLDAWDDSEVACVRASEDAALDILVYILVYYIAVEFGPVHLRNRAACIWRVAFLRGVGVCS
jgi:hypothetical protein